jgi:hypothetical protein
MDPGLEDDLRVLVERASGGGTPLQITALRVAALPEDI